MGYTTLRQSVSNPKSERCNNCKRMLSVKGKVALIVVGILLAIGVIGWTGGVAAYQTTPDYYLAVGDSVAVGQGASVPERFGYVGLFNQFYQADHPGEEGLTNLAAPGETSATFLSGQITRVLETIHDPDTEVKVVTLTLGISDLLPVFRSEPCNSDLAGAACQQAVATARTTFADNYLSILAQLNLALAQDPGEGRVLVTTYYNPFDGTNNPLEGPVDAALLGNDGAVNFDCAADPEEPNKLGFNDVIACSGGILGAEIIDVYSLFNDAAPALTHIAEGNIHPNNEGYQAIADAVIATYKR
jgi:lysophospholipase L1-like esterase